MLFPFNATSQSEILFGCIITYTDYIPGTPMDHARDFCLRLEELRLQYQYLQVASDSIRQAKRIAVVGPGTKEQMKRKKHVYKSTKAKYQSAWDNVESLAGFVGDSFVKYSCLGKCIASHFLYLPRAFDYSAPI